MTSRQRVKRAIHFEGPDRVPHYLPDGRENDLLWLWIPKPPPRQEWTHVGDNDVMIDCWGTTFQRVAGGRIGRGEVLKPGLPTIVKQADYLLPDLLQPAFFENAKAKIAENAASENPKYVLAVMPFASLNEGTHNLTGIENMGLEVLSERFGGRLAFWCPVDIQKTMIHGTSEAVRAYAKLMIETLGSHNGGFISMAYSTPNAVEHSSDNMAAMCEAFRTYGIYTD